MDYYLLLKWVHVLSSTILFGFGAGTAFYLWSAHRTRNPATIAAVGRMVVQADWIFTGTSGVVQPASGLMLAHLAGFPLDSSWIVISMTLYVIAFACWAPVVWLQIKAQRLAQAALEQGTALGAEYERAMRWWFLLGWPAFIGLTATFWMMIAKPDLW